MTLCYNVLCLY